MQYDVRGNVTDNGTNLGGFAFTYDHSNQPTAVSGSATATYVYDGNLKRVKEVRGGKTIYNVFSKVTGGLIYRFDDATGAANDIRTDYVNVGGAALRLKKTGTGGFVAEYTHFDSQGSAVAATDAAGTVTWRERYAPYGEELLKPAANDNNTAYTGHLKDDATGLTYMQARYYDPIIGRFLSTDPIGYQDQLNLYAYVANDPVNNIDPNGEALLALANPFVRAVIGGAIGAVVGGGVNSVAQVIRNGGLENFSVGEAIGAAGAGGTVGAAVAANPTLATQPGVLAPISGASAAAGSIAGDAIDQKSIDGGKALAAGLGGAVGGPIGAAAGKGIKADVVGAVAGEAGAAAAAVAGETLGGLGAAAVSGAKEVAGQLYDALEGQKDAAACNAGRAQEQC